MSASRPVKVAIAGALGRMGQAVRKAVDDHPGLEFAGGFDRPGEQGEGLVPRDEALGACDVLIDFTAAEASVEIARLCAERGGPALVTGATGLSEAQIADIREAAGRAAIVRSGNFSLGINVLLGLVRQAAERLGPEDWDIEVFEAHHRRKVDAPSGTALMLAEAAAAGRGIDLAQWSERARDGITGERRVGAIGFSVVRGGGIVGEHKVMLASEDEVLSLAHSASERSLFAKGAARAALWVAGRGPGLYDMQDVLGFADAS
ncbi:MAG TPA: 4-hydroxy-tetrahydrodipicolinate reductase [Caulobacteraceae bacterium]|nr:4-hydroxy-tetrahydrodipicolinate reductase [Caulobacteraceae bacterium]